MTVNTRLGKITADKEVLDMLSLSLLESSCSLEKRGEHERAEQYKKRQTKSFVHWMRWNFTEVNKLSYWLDRRKRGKKNEKISYKQYYDQYFFYC